jgi:hypothetical protein
MTDNLPTNKDRAIRAAQMLKEFADSEQPWELIVDLMHFCDQVSDCDFEEQLERARHHHPAEVREEAN